VFIFHHNWTHNFAKSQEYACDKEPAGYSSYTSRKPETQLATLRASRLPPRRGVLLHLSAVRRLSDDRAQTVIGHAAVVITSFGNIEMRQEVERLFRRPNANGYQEYRRVLTFSTV